MSRTPDLLLSVRDAEKNETDRSLDQEIPKEEDGPAPPKLPSVRHYCSVPDLRNSSLLCCSRQELSKLISRIKAVMSASAVNIFTGTLVSGVFYLPEGRAQGVVLRWQWRGPCFLVPSLPLTCYGPLSKPLNLPGPQFPPLVKAKLQNGIAARSRDLYF